MKNVVPIVENQVCVRIGTAGWSIPANNRSEFSQTGTVLEKYATRFNAVEINSSFYRPHQLSTYKKWASQVPADFSFSVKLPRTITHHSKLIEIAQPLNLFAEQVSGLGSKLGCVLVQLPPSLAFSKPHSELAFAMLRQVFACSIVCEPRHRTWFSSDVDKFFLDAGVARVAADPALCSSASIPAGDMQTIYYRLHGSPDIYYSDYSIDSLKNYARLINDQKQSSALWCIFDNTASGRATSNALTMQQLLTL